jgi:hypothetical protein
MIDVLCLRTEVQIFLLQKTKGERVVHEMDRLGVLQQCLMLFQEQQIQQNSGERNKISKHGISKS